MREIPKQHREVFRAWLTGAKIEMGHDQRMWIEATDPDWAEHLFYRVK